MTTKKEVAKETAKAAAKSKPAMFGWGGGSMFAIIYVVNQIAPECGTFVQGLLFGV